MTTTTEASTEAPRLSRVDTTLVWRNDASIQVTHTTTSSPEPFVVRFLAPDCSTPLTLYLSEGQALALYHRLGDALIDAAEAAK